MHSAEKVLDTTLDEKIRRCIVVMVLYNQPEACASDLGDDQSRCLLLIDICMLYVFQTAKQRKLRFPAHQISWLSE